MASFLCIVLLILSAVFSMKTTNTTFCFASVDNTTTDSFSTDGATPDALAPATAISQFLEAHNGARRQVGVPPLSWDTKLAKFARAYAEQRRRDCALVHSPGYAYGENIFWGQGRRWSIPDAVAVWVDERQWYHYDTNSCSAPDCTHYTQIVWRTTRRLGCAKIICDSGDTFIVCEYYPHGNYIGARPYRDPKS